jgi:hypothetical protein
MAFPCPFASLRWCPISRRVLPDTACLGSSWTGCEQVLCERQVLLDNEPAQIRGEIRAELEDAIAFARRSPEPPPDVALRYVFATDIDRQSP